MTWTPADTLIVAAVALAAVLSVGLPYAAGDWPTWPAWKRAARETRAWLAADLQSDLDDADRSAWGVAREVLATVLAFGLGARVLVHAVLAIPLARDGSPDVDLGLVADPIPLPDGQRLCAGLACAWLVWFFGHGNTAFPLPAPVVWWVGLNALVLVADPFVAVASILSRRLDRHSITKRNSRTHE